MGKLGASDDEIGLPLDGEEVTEILRLAMEYFLYTPLTAKIAPRKYKDPSRTQVAASDLHSQYSPERDELTIYASSLFGMVEDSLAATEPLLLEAGADIATKILRCSQDQPLGLMHGDPRARPSLARLITEALAECYGDQRGWIDIAVLRPAECEINYWPTRDAVSIRMAPLHKWLIATMLSSERQILMPGQMAEELKLFPSMAYLYIRRLVEAGFLRCSEGYLLAVAKSQGGSHVTGGNNSPALGLKVERRDAESGDG